jgi:hypothetical protein
MADGEQIADRMHAYLKLDGNGALVVRSSRLLRFWLKVSNTNSEIGTTCLARARAAHRASPTLRRLRPRPCYEIISGHSCLHLGKLLKFGQNLTMMLGKITYTRALPSSRPM